MLKLKRQFSLLSLLVLVAQLFAQGPNDSGTYYKNADGQKGKALKTALFNIISTHKDIGYSGLYACYEQTDKRADGKVWDMYSNTTNFSFSDRTGNYKKEGDMYNREHSVPQSWFKEASPMKADIVHVVPTDGYVNNRRSNYPFGETSNPTYTSNNDFSKVGPSSVDGYSGTVFEPNDEYKGDFARIYFYMATCYEDKIAGWVSNGTASTVLDGTSYPAYKTWYINMLLRWAKEDPVSQKEIDRNNAVYGCQQNRNPYVDYPGLEQYVWGDKQDSTFCYDNYDGTTPTPNPDPTPDPTPDPDPDPDPDPTPGDGYVFSKVTSTADIVAGGYYLIVYEDGNVALAEKGGSGNDVRSYADVTISDSKITTTVGETGKPRQLLLGGSEGAYTFYDAVDKEYLALTKSENKLQSSTSTSDATAQWTVTVSSDVATIKNCKYTAREIRYNKDAPRFACYKTGTQQAVSLYRRVTSTGISTLKPSAADTCVDVYTLSGVMVRKNVESSAALKGLAKGVYIVGGKKYAVE